MPIRLHWILSVIDPYNNTVYYLDSLCEDGTTGTKRDIISDLQDIVNTALFQFQSDREITTKLKMNTKWLKIKCPQQPNCINCGHYVMRFMKEIISHTRTQIPENYFSDCQFPKYDQEQIDEVRIHWVRYVLQQI
ncbi:ubiquitin-like-specific protease 1 isoform X1 [Chenopodium quinoa]|uniref:ubiquitin-like-specific protease 1 isoform X1 n=1 Tax=Chenopodium quinoa TaxID=63459 RepID=UPI000B790B11|nr:ubiquitin-like-specific protease 1 isoform X1 [Chenopodium quinoa]XP_021764032.1 ubiquitin-like-specific protease 1 isoform X1 [Chenopodium quinoa]